MDNVGNVFLQGNHAVVSRRELRARLRCLAPGDSSSEEEEDVTDSSGDEGSETDDNQDHC
eukprot:SAG11_NODE_12186_length_717_cov_0.736246_2_plen_60_part_00